MTSDRMRAFPRQSTTLRTSAAITLDRSAIRGVCQCRRGLRLSASAGNGGRRPALPRPSSRSTTRPRRTSSPTTRSRRAEITATAPLSLRSPNSVGVVIAARRGLLAHTTADAATDLPRRGRGVSILLDFGGRGRVLTGTMRRGLDGRRRRSRTRLGTATSTASRRGATFSVNDVS